MCGIVGAALERGSVARLLVDALRVLEYRGYDSSGLGVLAPAGVLVRRRKGRLEELERELADGALDGLPVGVGHTRWATHGEPSDLNAHPHTDERQSLALVHNGIIENYQELRAELAARGVEFRSQTDTEVLSHLVGDAIAAGQDALEALRASLLRVRGYYAVALVTRVHGVPRLLCARAGPPLVVATTSDAAYLASDPLALLAHTREVRFLEDGDIAELAPGKVRIVRLDGSEVERPVKRIDWDPESTSKGGFPHYMLKEIHEQPDVLARTAFERIRLEQGDVDLGGGAFSDEALRALQRIQITACGTALHAGLIARYLIEGLARLPVDIDYASELRYRRPPIAPGTLGLAISQSGETADTLAAMRTLRELGAPSISICNSPGSTLVRESQGTILTQAGPEIGVASTKAFVAQVLAACLLAVRLGRARGALSREHGQALLADLRALRPKLEMLVGAAAVARVQEIAARRVGSKGFLFLGRGINYPVALEGALKLKEISYMHAEGYPAGEMKHGPIALVEPSMSIVVIASAGSVAEKVLSNVEQVRARGGQVICVGSDRASLAIADDTIEVPSCSEWLSPVLNVVPLQLFAYTCAALRGCDIDKPRNLAKSVTVE